jgi:hypothetical protein
VVAVAIRASRRRGAGLAAACVLSLLTVAGLVGPHALAHPGATVVGRNPASDFQVMTWSLSWWPWALQHGVNPLHTDLLWAPSGFSALWMTTIPLPALVALPLTLTAGPLVAYNVLMVAAVVLATAAAFLLCFELTEKVAPSVLGGIAFGLSPYMLGHTLSQHLDLTFVFPLPLLALLAVRYARGKTGGRRYVLGSALLLLALLGTSLELFLEVTVVLAVAAAISLAAGGSARRASLRLLTRLSLAYAACLPVLVPIAVLGLASPHGTVQRSPSGYAVDLLNLVLPTPTLLTGRPWALRGVTSTFVGNIGEQDGYIGLPLLVVALLALKAEWRRGAWIAGLIAGIAVVFSLGPVLTVGGHPLLALPFSFARLPLLGAALPARMSLLASLGLACLCAVWLARPGRLPLRLALGGLVVASLVPNFSPAPRLFRAWATTTAFGWSTPRVPAGFVDDRRWTSLVAPGTNVLVLPTQDRTAAAYWQVKSGSRFTLAVPGTPFVPPSLAADPTVAFLANDVLPQFDGRRLGAARLRAFFRTARIGAVVTTPAAGARWKMLVREATASRPLSLRGSQVFRVRTGLAPLVRDGAAVRASGARAWLHFDGVRAHLLVAYRGRTVALSAPNGDAERPWLASGSRGGHAVVFTEWRDHRLLLRVATATGSHWRVSTLDRSRTPIWSQRVAVTRSGAVIAGWIAETGAVRSLTLAVLPAHGRWQRPVTLDVGDGLGTIALATGGGDTAVVAWHDSLASEDRVRAALYSRGSWGGVVTLARSLSLLDSIRVSRGAAAVRWRLWEPGLVWSFEAQRRGAVWGPAILRARMPNWQWLRQAAVLRRP